MEKSQIKIGLHNFDYAIETYSNMPEGPEAHTIATKLRSRIVGKTILSANILGKPEVLEISGLTLPNKIIGVTAYGKRPIFILERGYLVTFLAMKGKWSFARDSCSILELVLGESHKQSDTLTIEEPELSIWYHGLGPAGKITYYSNEAQLNHYFKDYGPDMLANPCTVEEYARIIKVNVPSSMQLSVFLLEQKYVSGVGNYLRSEIMYKCRLRPDTLMGNLSDAAIISLYNATKEIMMLSYQHGGLTMKDYWDPDGQKGVYPKMVYMNNYDPFGNPVITDKCPLKRKIYWVQQLQS